MLRSRTLSRGAQSTWTPQRLPSLKRWGEGTNGLASDCASWTDLSPAGNTLNVVSATKPTYLATAANGQPAAKFVSASSTVLSRAATNVVAAGSFYGGCVVRVDAVTSNDAFYCNTDAGIGGFELNRISSVGSKYNFLYDGVANLTDGLITNGSFVVVTWAATAAGTIDFFANGVHTSLGPSTALTPGAGAGLSMGARWNSTIFQNFADCTIAADALGNVLATPGQLRCLQRYWSRKYGLAI